MKRRQIQLIAMMSFILCSLISGCASQQSRARSSVVDYLYPKGAETIMEPAVPVLMLPLNVGIAFVPDQSAYTSGSNFWAGSLSASTLTDAEKVDLLEKVARHFRRYDYINEITVIPPAYLTPHGSFANLGQIQTMYGTDVIALVSYDQVQFTDEGLLSLTYWTLIGGYFVAGEKNDTSTMLDTAVFDVKSQNMLFRAPGTSQVKSSATPVNLSESLRKDSRKSFAEATDMMIQNLDIQLASFKDKVKQQPEKVQIVHNKGYSGSALGGPEFILLAVLGCIAALRRRGAEQDTHRKY